MSDTSQKEENIIKLILSEMDDITEVLNSSFMKEFGNLRNIKSENNILSLKQEIIARWGYFLNVKKKYALHLINKEGINTDKLETKGLITRRSDYPALTKKKIGDILDMLVMKDSVNTREIREFVLKTEAEMKELCLAGRKEVARPVSFSKEKEEYKKIPTQILGMELWNVCEYDYFVPGTKGYLFKILSIDQSKAPKKALGMSSRMTDKNKCVVLPYEEEQLPDYFVIDVDSMMDFCWTSRVNELLEPISNLVFSDTETKNAEIISDLFN
jgi:hypothetical protein